MAGSDAEGQRANGLLVAALTLLLPLAGALLSVAPIAPPDLGAAFVTIRPRAVAAEQAPPPDGLADGAPVAEAAGPSDAAPGAEPMPAPAVAVEAVVAATPAPIPVAAASPAPREEAWTRESAFNFVAVGVDQRDEGELTRTDTLMIGSVDLVQRRLSIVSIPRDLVVEIPGYGFDRVNTAYVYGEQFKEPDGGIGLLRRTIEANFGVPIHHYGLIDFNCFRAAVDAIGGVTIDVPRTIVDDHYPTEDYGYTTVRFEAGRQRMNGEQALAYARTRNADNDFGRIRRQQLVVSALRGELLRLRSLPALPTILGGCRNMRSDLGWRDYFALAGVVRNLKDGDVTFRAIDEKMAVDAHLATGAWVLLPRWEPIRAMIRESFAGARPLPVAADAAERAAPRVRATSAGTSASDDPALTLSN